MLGTIAMFAAQMVVGEAVSYGISYAYNSAVEPKVVPKPRVFGLRNFARSLLVFFGLKNSDIEMDFLDWMVFWGICFVVCLIIYYVFKKIFFTKTRKMRRK
jgi:hypothetical protein